MTRDKKKFKVAKLLDFEIEAVDQTEADECVTQWINIELQNNDNPFDITYIGERALPNEKFNS